MKILIIAYYFPPENKAGIMAALRPYSWAKYWQQEGHEICVMTTSKDLSSDLLTRLVDHSQEQSSQTYPVRIEGVQYLPSLSKPGRSPQPNSAANPNVSDRFDWHILLRSILINLRSTLGLGSLLYGSNLWIMPACQRALQLYQHWPYEIIVSTFGPPANPIVAGLLKQKLNLYWVADYRDLWDGYGYLAPRWPFSTLERQVENYFVSKADLITTVSTGFSKTLSQRFHIKTLTIPNGFDLEDFPQLVGLPDSPQGIRLVHTGTIYPGKRDPELLFKAIHLLKSTQPASLLNLQILFYGWDLGNLTTLVDRYDLHSIVQTPGYVDRQEALQIQQQATALIYLDWNDPNVEGIVGGKLYEYMFAGRPILCISPSSQTAAAQLIQQTGTGMCLNHSVEAIAETLLQVLNGQPLDYSPRQEILQQYTRASLARKMLQEVMDHLPG